MGYELYHHGIKGMKWGVRRYRNSDGSLTPAGKKRYGSENKIEEPSRTKKVAKAAVNTAVGLGIGFAGAKIASNPKVIAAVGRAMDKIGKLKMKEVTKSMDSLSGIYSKKLGREFTIAEAIAEGLSDLI